MAVSSKVYGPAILSMLNAEIDYDTNTTTFSYVVPSTGIAQFLVA